MKTFFMTFEVVPTVSNEHYSIVKGALAHCWVLENNRQSAYAKASFFVSKYDWKIEKMDTFPVETTEEHFLEKDLGLEQYIKAQEEGIAIIYTGWARDEKSNIGPIEFKPSFKFNLAEFIKKQKRMRNKGRCLHYDGGHRCGKIINAHSIQKNQSLSAIAENGHVYKLSSDISTLKKNKGNVEYVKSGIKNVSTFLGFCEKHDNELFKPIDKSPLYPTDQQIFLYAYRSLCRELFIKENVLNLIEEQVAGAPGQSGIKEYLTDYKIGTAFGLENLKRQKSMYDDSLREKRYVDIRYVLFISEQAPFIAFSGLFYPDYDFIGRQLQNLGNHKSKLDLITMCSVPMLSGFGFLFSWHNSSSKVCVDFMRSLATTIYDNNKLGDLLFRLIVSNCENHAISPRWWDHLSPHHKEQIRSHATLMASTFSITTPKYLMEGLEGIARWKFERVINNMD